MSQEEKAPITIRDVASAANVSTATVSHVINNTRFVSKKTKARVLEAVEKTGYRPNYAARRLRNGESGILGMLVPNSSNPFFAEVVKAFEEYSSGLGYSILLVNCDRNDQEQVEKIRMLSAHGVDGMAVLLADPQPECTDFISREIRVPVLSLDTKLSENCLVVKDNSVKGGRLAAEHIWANDRRKIAVLAGPQNHQRMHERLVGVKQYLTQENAEILPEFIVHSSLDFDGGATATEKLIGQCSKDNRPDAIICFNDAMAIGAIKVLHSLELSIPKDISVIGYDDISLSKYAIPSLTTISQNSKRLGCLAAEALIKRIQKSDISESEIIIEPRLIPRESA